MYSTSIVKRATEFLFVECYETSDCPKIDIAPDVGFLLLLSTLDLAESASEYHASSKLSPFRYQSPRVAVPDKYLRILFVVLRWESVGVYCNRHTLDIISSMLAIGYCNDLMM